MRAHRPYFSNVLLVLSVLAWRVALALPCHLGGARGKLNLSPGSIGSRHSPWEAGMERAKVGRGRGGNVYCVCLVVGPLSDSAVGRISNIQARFVGNSRCPLPWCECRAGGGESWKAARGVRQAPSSLIYSSRFDGRGHDGIDRLREVRQFDKFGGGQGTIDDYKLMSLSGVLLSPAGKSQTEIGCTWGVETRSVEDSSGLPENGTKIDRRWLHMGYRNPVCRDATVEETEELKIHEYGVGKLDVMGEGLGDTEANFGLVILGQLEWERESLRPVEISIKAVELDVSRQISMHFEQYNCLLKLWGYFKAFLMLIFAILLLQF